MQTELLWGVALCLALEIKARGQTPQAIKKLIGLQAEMARVVHVDKDVDVPVEAVIVGDDVALGQQTTLC